MVLTDGNEDYIIVERKLGFIKIKKIIENTLVYNDENVHVLWLRYRCK